MKGHKTVDAYIEHSGACADILILLRELLTATDLEEMTKWGGPVYTLNGKNVIGLGAFKQYTALWFFQGAFLKDKKKKLVNAQEGVTKGLRQWRFASVQELRKDILTVKEYVDEAIKNQMEGKEIKPERKKPVIVPPELNAVLKKNVELKKKFNLFTPGKKREFTDYISEAKRAETKMKRIEKIIPMILNGVGLNDKYRK